MSLMTFHKIFISTAIVFCMGFSVREVVEYSKTGRIGTLLLGVSFVIISVGLGLYLKSIVKRLT